MRPHLRYQGWRQPDAIAQYQPHSCSPRDGVAGRGETIAVEVNGISVGAIELQAAWGEGRLDAPQALWQRGPNVITLRTTSPVDLDRVAFMEPER